MRKFILVTSLLCSYQTVHAVTVLNPPDLNLPNYNRIPIGHIGALEGGAFIARAHGSEAIWYNVAGVAKNEGDHISANALLLEFTNVELTGLGTSSDTDGFSQIPTFFGTAFDVSDTENNWSVGFAVTTSNTYSQHVKLDQNEYNPSTTLTTSSVLDSTTTIKFLEPHIAFGYRRSQRWTLGGSLWLNLANTQTSESLGIRVRNPGNTVRLSQVQFANGDYESLDLGISFGGQWLATDNWNFGFQIKSPSMNISNTGSLNIEVTQDLIAETNEISFRDNDMEYTIRHPLTIGFGAAYVTQKWELEADIQYYDGPGDYTVYKTGEQLDLLNYNKGSTVTTQAFQDVSAVRTDIDSIFNISIGGHYLVHDSLAIHGGIYTDFSPVAHKNDPVYTKLDVFGITVGISKIGDINTSSIGLNYTWGSDDTDVSDSFSAASGEGEIKTNNFGILFATTFRY